MSNQKLFFRREDGRLNRRGKFAVGAGVTLVGAPVAGLVVERALAEHRLPPLDQFSQPAAAQVSKLDPTPVPMSTQTAWKIVRHAADHLRNDQPLHGKDKDDLAHVRSALAPRIAEVTEQIKSLKAQLAKRPITLEDKAALETKLAGFEEDAAALRAPYAGASIALRSELGPQVSQKTRKLYDLHYAFYMEHWDEEDFDSKGELARHDRIVAQMDSLKQQLGQLAPEGSEFVVKGLYSDLILGMDDETLTVYAWGAGRCSTPSDKWFEFVKDRAQTHEDVVQRAESSRALAKVTYRDAGDILRGTRALDRLGITGDVGPLVKAGRAQAKAAQTYAEDMNKLPARSAPDLHDHLVEILRYAENRPDSPYLQLTDGQRDYLEGLEEDTAKLLPPDVPVTISSPEDLRRELGNGGSDLSDGQLDRVIAASKEHGWPLQGAYELLSRLGRTPIPAESQLYMYDLAMRHGDSPVEVGRLSLQFYTLGGETRLMPYHVPAIYTKVAGDTEQYRRVFKLYLDLSQIVFDFQDDPDNPRWVAVDKELREILGKRPPEGSNISVWYPPLTSSADAGPHYTEVINPGAMTMSPPW